MICIISRSHLSHSQYPSVNNCPFVVSMTQFLVPYLFPTMRRRGSVRGEWHFCKNPAEAYKPCRMYKPHTTLRYARCYLYCLCQYFAIGIDTTPFALHYLYRRPSLVSIAGRFGIYIVSYELWPKEIDVFAEFAMPCARIPNLLFWSLDDSTRVVIRATNWTLSIDSYDERTKYMSITNLLVMPIVSSHHTICTLHTYPPKGWNSTLFIWPFALTNNIPKHK